MKKVKIIMGSILIALICVLGVVYYKRDAYFDQFLRNSLKIEFKDSKVDFFKKNVTLNEVSYKKVKKMITNTYTAEKVMVDFKEINVKERLAHINKAEVEGFNFITEINDEKEKVAFQEETPTSTPTNEVVALDKKQENKVVISDSSMNDSKKKKKKDKWYSPFKDLVKKIEEVAKEKMFSPSSLVDDDLLDAMINEKIGKDLEKKLNKEVVKINYFYGGLKEENTLRKSVDPLSNNQNLEKKEWTVKIDSLDIDSKLFNTVLKGNIKNIVVPLCMVEEESPIKIELSDIANINKISGELSIDKANIAVNAPEFDYKMIPDAARYIESGEFNLTQTLDYKDDILVIDGMIIVKNLKLNTDNLVNEILKKNKIPLVDPRAQILKYMLKKINSAKLIYTYDSKEGKLVIKTDLQKQLSKILTNELKLQVN